MFDELDILPADPLLGLIGAFKKDTNPHKVDLGVGVYKDETGHTAIMSAVQKAAGQHLANETSKTYLGPGGVPGFVKAIKELILTPDCNAIKEQRLAALQVPGGCGALRIAAELLARTNHKVTIWVSDPTWANHVPLIKSAGVSIKTYPYFDAQSGAVNFAKMDDCIARLGKDDVLLLHGCCHNPTGADLSFEHWQQIAKRGNQQGFLPFIDLAYQGLGDNLEDDAKGLRHLSGQVEQLLIASSCSKNFGLYRERVGCLMVQTQNSQQATAAQTHIQDLARGNYSMPPAWGAYLVDIVLNDPQLKQQWQQELAAMASRIKSLRAGLLQKIQAQGIDKDFSFITQQKGMFSYLGITKEQVERLRKERSIYMASSSRINVAGLNTHCLDYVAESLKSVF